MSTPVLRYIDPLRHPEAANRSARTRRAFALLLSTLLVPGSAQVVAGNRRLGRLGLGVFLTFWTLVIVAVVLFFVRRQWLFALTINPITMTLLTVLLVVLGLFWAVLFVDAFRLAGMRFLSPRNRGILAGALAVVVFVTSGGLFYAASLTNAQRGLLSSVFGGGTVQAASDGRYNILLLGSDAGKGRTGVRPDSISLISVDAKTGQAVSIGLPRNLQEVPFAAGSPLATKWPNGFNCGNECLLNAVYQQGEQNKDLFPDPALAGAQAMKDAVGGATGLKVQYYAMIDLQGFESLIDAMGGLTITSKKRVPISGPVIKGTDRHTAPRGWIEPGKQNMNGKTALWFARSREGASDYERMTRQRCVQKAMLTQLDPATLLTRFQAIAGAAPNVVSTDIPQAQLGDFLDLVLKTKDTKLGELALVPPQVKPASPDFTAIHALVQQTLKADAEAAAAEPGAGPQLQALGAGAQNLAAGAADEPKDSDICTVP